MGRFETAWLSSEANLAALADLSGAWIDRVHECKPQTTIVLDMDSSVSETHGAQEGTAYNGHFACMCYHPLLYRGIGCQAPSTLFVSLHGGLASLRGRRCGRHIMGSEGRGRTICSTD
jgi:hypothetical protein